MALEEQIFEEHNAAHAYDAEISRLSEIWSKEQHRLYDEVCAGKLLLTAAERYALVEATPEYQEYSRLYYLQDGHFLKMDELVRQMWATAALTPKGRAAKVWVLLGCVMDPEEGWRDYDGHCRVDPRVEQARALLIELAGGEPGVRLRDQFAA